MSEERSCIVFFDRLKKCDDDWWKFMPVFQEISDGTLSGSYEEFGKLWQELVGIAKRFPLLKSQGYLQLAINNVVYNKQQVAPHPTGAIISRRRKR